MYKRSTQLPLKDEVGGIWWWITAIPFFKQLEMNVHQQKV